MPRERPLTALVDGAQDHARAGLRPGPAHKRGGRRIGGSPPSPVAIVASGTVLLLAYRFLPAWGIAGAAAAFGLAQGIVVPLFAYERKRNGSTGGELLAK